MGKEKSSKYNFNNYSALAPFRGREMPRNDTKTRYLRASCAPESYAFMRMAEPFDDRTHLFIAANSGAH